MSAESAKPLLVVRTLVYNHAPFLRDCLNGIVMQETTFPFVAVVHDDASTDGSTEIIREYEEKYPHIIKPIYETDNQYSKRNGSIKRIMNAACQGYKYHAMCEGDDYWTDPHKLQKQVNYLETHPECTMVCSDAVVLTKKGELTEEDFQRRCWKRYSESREMATEDIIEEGGLFIHTASIVYRSWVRDAYPEACIKCHVGDYMLQVMAALQGKVYYFHEKMVVYRLECGNSFTAQEKRQVSPAKAKAWNTEVVALEAMDVFSERRYTASFHRAATRFVLSRCRRFPYIRSEIMHLMGHTLLYNFVAPYTAVQAAGLHNMWRHRVKKFCFHPYYPFSGSSFLLPRWMQFFYAAQGAKRTFKLGSFSVFTIVNGTPRKRWYLLGCRVR